LLQAEGDRKAEPGYGHDRVAERWAEISPLHIIEESLAITTGSAAPPPPPPLVLFGESDPLVPVHRETSSSLFTIFLRKRSIYQYRLWTKCNGKGKRFTAGANDAALPSRVS